MSSETLSDLGVVRLVKAYEPRLDIRADREFVAMMGSANVSTRSYRADTISNNQVVWSLTTPSVRVGVDRSIDLEMTFEINFTPSSVGSILSTALYRLSDVGPRAFPIHSIADVMSLRLNDQQFTVEFTEIIQALLQYGNEVKDRQYNMGSSPHLLDRYWKYDNPTAPRAPFTSWLSSGEEDSRNIGLWARRTSPLTLEFTFIEQLMISPLEYGNEVQCLFGIQNIDLSLTFSKLMRIMSGDIYSALFNPSIPQAGKANPVVSIKDAQLHVTYLQPQASQVIPARLNYPYYQIRKFSQSIPGTFAPTDSLGQIRYNNITLHEIPRRLYVFSSPVISGNVELPNGNGDLINTDQVRQPDYFAAIDKITLNFDSQDGRLSTLTSYDLWKIATKNGLKKTYIEWSQMTGSVLCLEFGTDLNLNPLLAPGCRGNFQLSMEVTYRDVRNLNTITNLLNNTEEENKIYKAYLVVVPTGIMTIENQLITVSIGSITEQQIYDAPWAEGGLRLEVKTMYGSGNFTNIWKAIKKVGKVALPIVENLSGVLGNVLSSSSDPRAQKVALASQLVNQGLKGARGSGRSSGGARVRCSSLSRRM